MTGSPSVRSRRRTPRAGLFEALADEADALAYLLDGLIADPQWAEVGRAVFLGPGAAVVLDAVRAAHPRVTVEVSESSTGVAVLRAHLGEGSSSIVWAPARGADLVVGAFALAHRSDDDAHSALGAMRTLSDRAVVIEASRPDGLSPNAAEVALLTFAQTGAAPRSIESIEALAGASGWQVDRVTPLGWGVEATWLRGI